MAAGFEYLCPVTPNLRAVDGHRDHCDHCHKDVYDLSTMTRQEAAAVLVAEVAPCVRLRVSSGRARFMPDRPALSALETGPGGPLGQIARLGALAGALAGCAAHAPVAPPAPTRSVEAVMCAAVQRLDALVAEAEAAAADAALSAERAASAGAEQAAAWALAEKASGDAVRAVYEMRTTRRYADEACDRAKARARARSRAGRSEYETLGGVRRNPRRGSRRPAGDDQGF